MNSGAGGIAGFFIHERLFEEAKSFPRLTGWWGHRIETRFDMDNGKAIYESPYTCISKSKPLFHVS